MGSLVGLALIAKNEAERLPTLLASIEGAFDRVVLLDTGSDDDTVKVFTDWASGQHVLGALDYSVGSFDWCDDFAAARRAADELLGSSVMWTCWADCDDTIHDALAIRGIVAAAPPTTVAFLVGYDYAQAPDGTTISYLWRERMVRRGHGQWVGRVHEAQNIEGGQVQPVSPEALEWRHAKHHTVMAEGRSNKRNLRILRKWAKDEPKNSRVVSYLGIESQMSGFPKAAMKYYRRYLALNPEWTEERAQVHRRISQLHMDAGDHQQAINSALEALQLLPSWPDSYITLAEAYLRMEQHDKAKEWAVQAINRGAPQNTLLIVNPTDYTYLPRKLLAAAVAAEGDYDRALSVAKEASQFSMDEGLVTAMQQWQSLAKRQHTADTVCAMAEQLIAHDEQYKAKVLLEQCPPAFVIDHPKVVALRSMLRERIMWADDPALFSEHYATGGSKPEDFIEDAKVDPLCEYLPRTNFLLHGIKETLDA